MQFKNLIFIAVVVLISGLPPLYARLDQSATELLQEAMPDIGIIDSGDIAGTKFKWVLLDNGTLIHMPVDKKYFFVGTLYRFDEQQGIVNITESQVMSPRRSKLVNKVAKKDMVIFSPKATVKAKINVFTDIDCSYCRQFHQEVPELTSAGVEIRYLAYPRQGIDSVGYAKLVTAWCSKDRNKALTRMKKGDVLASLQCSNPVSDHYQLGGELGVRGTPTMILEDGEMIPGYLPAKELLARLDAKKAKNN